MKRLLFVLLLCLSSFLTTHAQKFENLAMTPPMGWNSWNKFACNINEELIKGIADQMVATGLRDAGYVYLNLDDCWLGTRDENGFITCDKQRFPSGIKALADYVHSKGLKLGIYSDAGRLTCQEHPGSLGHEYQDALMYARWEVDYLKYDWCNTENINPIGAYTLMRDALRAAGRPIVFSMCEGGANQPWKWAKEVGHLWRTTMDIGCHFEKPIPKNGEWYPLSVLEILDQQVDIRDASGPGHWNDPDMLEVGNGMTVNQDRAHFTMWCMLSAPLILGNDLRSMSVATEEIIKNAEAIAIDQDSLGITALRVEQKDSVDVWLKPLANGDWAFCLLNRAHTPAKFDIDWQKYNKSDSLSARSTGFDKITYSIKDVWAKKKAGTTKKNKSVVIPAQDVVMYRLQPTK
ncbi:MAG: glycoside hydrolase family 27 protein [Bacteroidales bacterium]|nr:glycoside hydrolase family 27 protein [Bacteroidales bacterium]